MGDAARARRPVVAVAGAGLAGLVAATEALAAGADVLLLDRDRDPCGATGMSAGWIWRYRDLGVARACAPAGDAGVQRAIVERLDADLAWLERAGADVVARSTGRPHTVGVRVDPRRTQAVLLDALDRAAPDAVRTGRAVVGAARTGDGRIELRVRVVDAAPGAAGEERHVVDALVCAGGGYARDLQRVARDCRAPDPVRDSWVLRATSGGDGSSMAAAGELGALRVPAGGECLVRLVPAGGDEPVDPAQLVRAGELQVDGHVLVVGDDDRVVERVAHDWSGAAAAWSLAREWGRGRLELPVEVLHRPIHAGGTVLDAVRSSIRDGAAGGRLRGGGAWLDVRAGITVTRGTLRVAPDGAVFGDGPVGSSVRAPVPGLWAAGADAACSGLGGTASGLAQALVLGRAAGRAAGRVKHGDRDSR